MKTSNAPTSATVVPISASADPPRSPTKDDHRLIFLKLNEVYEGETRGYATGWSDAKVAKDMGVPKAWVEEIRVQFFGEIRDNADMRKVLDEVAAHAEELKAIDGDRLKINAALMEARDKLVALSDEQARLQERIVAAEAHAKRIERDMADLRRLT